MKKKLLLFSLMISLLFCLCVISVSAETIIYEGEEIELVNNLGDPSWYTGTTANKIQDKESIVILKDENGNMTAYPSYYMLRYFIDGSTVYVAWANDKGVDYSFINEKATKNYTSGSVIYIEFPEGITACNYVNIWGKSEANVAEVVLPDSVTSMGYSAFEGAKSLKKVTLSKNLRIIDQFAFYSATNLETVIFPEGCALTTISTACFENCSKLSSVNLENCQSLITLGDRTFNGCTAIDRLSLPNSITTIGSQALNNLGDFELASDYLPTSLTSIGSYFLAYCKLENDVIYFPASFSSLSASYCFLGFTPKTSLTLVFLGEMTTVNLTSSSLATYIGTGSKQPLKLVFAQNQFSDLNNEIVTLVEVNGQKGFIGQSADGNPLYTKGTGTLSVKFDNESTYNLTGLGNDANGNTVYAVGSSASEIIFCGGDTVEISYTIRCNHTDKGWYRFHTTPLAYDVEGHKTADVHYNNREIQEGNCGYDEMVTNTCVICELQSIVVGEKATGKHIYTDDHNCETALVCETCEMILSEALTHNIKTIIAYASGYSASGLKSVACHNEGCNHTVSSSETDALFTFLGYSAAEYGDGGMSIGYKVNNEAINEYKSATGKEFSYGLFVAIKEKIGSNDIFDENGAAQGGVFAADITACTFDIFNLKVVGFNEDQTDTKFAIGAYTKSTLNGTTEYSYMQGKEPLTGDKYFFVSYNDVCKIVLEEKK